MKMIIFSIIFSVSALEIYYDRSDIETTSYEFSRPRGVYITKPIKSDFDKIEDRTNEFLIYGCTPCD